MRPCHLTVYYNRTAVPFHSRAAYFSMGARTMLPHSVQEPS